MRTRLAFAALLAGTFAGFVGLGAAAPAQTVPAAWDVIVTVRRDRVGADLVTVGARAAGYPAELLRAQMVALGERLGHPARGVAVLPEAIQAGNRASILRGSCAVDGLIGSDGGLAVAPIAQAFAGAPAPYTVKRMLVSFDGVTIVPGKTMAYHTAGGGSDLAFSGRPIGSSVEYDVDLRSQDPTRLVVHEADAAARASAPRAAPAAKSGPDPLTVALFVVAALAAGALVYCGLLLVGRRPVVKS